MVIAIMGPGTEFIKAIANPCGYDGIRPPYLMLQR